MSAPWAFVVQNKTSHCCIINAKSLTLEWVGQMIDQRQPSAGKPLRKIRERGGRAGYIRTCPTEVHNGWGLTTWDACDASIQRMGHAAPTAMIPSGWLPSQRIAAAWLAFIKAPTHPTDSLP